MIEELTWFPIGIPNLAPGSLPILKRLRNSLQVIIALDQLSQDNVIQVEKLGDPASRQRMTLSTPTPSIYEKCGSGSKISVSGSG